MDILGATNAVAIFGQGELGDKGHLSRGCVALAARKAHRLRRRPPCCQGTNQTPICCESCSFVEELPLTHEALLAYQRNKSRMNQ